MVLATLNKCQFADKPPLQVYASFLERGQYIASVSTCGAPAYPETEFLGRISLP